MKNLKTLLYTTFTDRDGEIDFTEMMHVLALLIAVQMFCSCLIHIFSFSFLDKDLIEFEFKLFAVLEGTYRTKQGIKDFTVYKNGHGIENKKHGVNENEKNISSVIGGNVLP